MSGHKRREIPGDDGETVVPMNVEGMPWYVPANRRKRPGSPESEAEPSASPFEGMTKQEYRAYKWAAVRAGLVIALVFGAAFALFIAFCDFIWFQ